jgi:hypothetical protein
MKKARREAFELGQRAFGRVVATGAKIGADRAYAHCDMPKSVGCQIRRIDTANDVMGPLIAPEPTCCFERAREIRAQKFTEERGEWFIVRHAP